MMLPVSGPSTDLLISPDSASSRATSVLMLRIRLWIWSSRELCNASSTESNKGHFRRQSTINHQHSPAAVISTGNTWSTPSGNSRLYSQLANAWSKQSGNNHFHGQLATCDQHNLVTRTGNMVMDLETVTSTGNWQHMVITVWQQSLLQAIGNILTGLAKVTFTGNWKHAAIIVRQQSLLQTIGNM